MYCLFLYIRCSSSNSILKLIGELVVMSVIFVERSIYFGILVLFFPGYIYVMYIMIWGLVNQELSHKQTIQS